VLFLVHRFCHPDEGGARFLRNVGSYKPHDVTTQKTPFFIVTAVKTSNLTEDNIDDMKDSFYEEFERIFHK
jgi:hypothetical protein